MRLSISLLAVAALSFTGCQKKGPETNPSAGNGVVRVEATEGGSHCKMKGAQMASGEAKAGCAAKAEMASADEKAHCAAKKAEMASTTAHPACTHAEGEACDHEAGAKEGRACCKAQLANAAPAAGSK